MTNMKDIAKIAGVSSATVSRVINNNGYVSHITRQKVESAVEKLDYVPNSQAVSLKKGATKTIGIIVPNITETITVLVKNFTLAAQKKGYTVILYLTENDPKKELNALELMRSKQLDGVFLIIRSNDWSTIESYTKYGPIVTWQRVKSSHISSVFIDQYDGYLLGLEYLYAKGCRNIINLYSDVRRLNTKSRIKAYEYFCKKYDLTPHSPEQFNDINSIQDGERIAHWLYEQKNKPDAFMTSSDAVAAGLVSQAQRLGFSLPEDFSVIGFDNIEISHLLDITTIDYSIYKQAENAFKMINNDLSLQKLTPEELAFTLIVRKTTK